MTNTCKCLSINKFLLVGMFVSHLFYKMCIAHVRMHGTSVEPPHIHGCINVWMHNLSNLIPI